MHVTRTLGPVIKFITGIFAIQIILYQLKGNKIHVVDLLYFNTDLFRKEPDTKVVCYLLYE